LDIYGQKDIAATLLKMQNKQAIAFQKNGHITITGQNTAKLDNAEQELINTIINGRINSKSAMRFWKQNRFDEAQELGYIQTKTVNDKKIMKNLYFALLSTLIAMILWGIFLANDIFNNILLSSFFLPIIGILIFIPWYLVARNLSYWKRGDVVWERTALGNEMAEKIAGLARFIHEFSLLSEAEKEQVALWEDYLVYAIVMEENEKIVKDICKQQKISLLCFGGLEI
jgi:uncharacterized membrane protein